MSFIQRELDKISVALAGGSGPQPELYAAQQALSWALEPSGFKSPYELLKGIREGSEDYQPLSGQPPS